MSTESHGRVGSTPSSRGPAPFAAPASAPAMAAFNAPPLTAARSLSVSSWMSSIANSRRAGLSRLMSLLWSVVIRVLGNALEPETDLVRSMPMHDSLVHYGNSTHGFLSSRCDTRCRGHAERRIGIMTPFERAERNEIGNTRLKAWRTTGSDTGLSTGQAADLRAASSCSHVHTSTGVRAHVRVRESKIDCGGANLWKMGARGSGISRLSSGAGRANSKGPPQPVPSDVARRTHRTQRLF